MEKKFVVPNVHLIYICSTKICTLRKLSIVLVVQYFIRPNTDVSGSSWIKCDL